MYITRPLGRDMAEGHGDVGHRRVALRSAGGMDGRALVEATQAPVQDAFGPSM
jgi:hypothetical protein